MHRLSASTSSTFSAGRSTRIPDRGNVDFIDEIRLTVAGTAGGTVIDTAKLGLKSLAVGAVGDDEKADWVLMTLDKHGIDTSAMQRIAGVPTSATILNVRPNGDRPALHVRGASDHFESCPTALRPGVRRADRASRRHRPPAQARRPAQRRPLAEAKRRGRTTTFDLIAANAETAHLVLPLLPHIDYFMPSIEEAQDMSGREGPEDCAEFYLDKGATACVFTLGGEGAYYAHRDGTRLQSPAYRIDVVDTTGCGDAFDAGFIAALHHQMDLETALRFAQAARPWSPPGSGRMPASALSSIRWRRCGACRSGARRARARARPGGGVLRQRNQSACSLFLLTTLTMKGWCHHG